MKPAAMTWKSLGLIYGLAAFVCFPAATRGDYSFQTFGIPSGNSTGQAFAYGISDSGQVALQSTAGYNFVREANGTFTAVSYPGVFITLNNAISSDGRIAGELVYSDFGPVGAFERSADGQTYTTISDPPGAVNHSTTLFGINSSGELVGSYTNSSAQFTTSFLRSADGQTYTTIQVPGEPAYYTSAFGINDKGQVVGTFFNGSIEQYFIRSADGLSYTTFSGPGQFDGGNSFYRGPSINDAGQVAGTYILNGVEHGFVRDSSGQITTVDVPGGYDFTNITGINNLGQLVGDFDSQPGGFTEAFIATPGLATVPEPASLAMVGLGLAAVAGFVRIRRVKAAYAA